MTKGILFLAAVMFFLAFFMGCAAPGPQNGTGTGANGSLASGATQLPLAKSAEYATVDGISFIPPDGFIKTKDGEYFALANGKVCLFSVSGFAMPSDRVLELDALGSSVAASIQKAGGKVEAISNSRFNSHDALELNVSMGGVDQKQVILQLKRNFALVGYGTAYACRNYMQAVLGSISSLKDA